MKRNKLQSKLLSLWDEYAPNYRKSFGKISVFQGFAKKMEEYLPATPGGIVLDGGCGPGLHFERIIRATRAKFLIGLDCSPKMLQEAERSRGRLEGEYDCEIKTVHADLVQGIPFPENHFDVQIYHLVLYYLPLNIWKEVLRETFRVAKPGGYVISTNVLERFDFRKEIGISWLIKETFFHPLAVFLIMKKIRPIMTKFQDLEQKGELSYPSREELISFHAKLGFKNISCQNIWKENTVIIKACKPRKG